MPRKVSVGWRYGYAKGSRCRKCRVRIATRPRCFCRKCYERQRDYSGDCTGTQPLPELPTQELPGSEAKRLVLRERASRFEQLHHPQDARNDGSPARNNHAHHKPERS